MSDVGVICQWHVSACHRGQAGIYYSDTACVAWRERMRELMGLRKGQLYVTAIK